MIYVHVRKAGLAGPGAPVVLLAVAGAAGAVVVVDGIGVIAGVATSTRTHELNEAMDDAEGERLRFELGPVELSLTVTVGREAAPGAKIRFWVIEAGADAKISREAVQDIKLVLSPRDMRAPLGPDGKPAAPLISGHASGGED